MTNEIEQKEAFEALNAFLEAHPFCKAGILITFYQGRRHIVSAEHIGRFPECNGWAGFPATDIHERMVGLSKLMARFDQKAIEVAHAVALHGAGSINARSAIQIALYEAAQIEIPKELD